MDPLTGLSIPQRHVGKHASKDVAVDPLTGLDMPHRHMHKDIGLADLPDEILEIIFADLPPPSLIACAMVTNVRLSSLAGSDYLWGALLARDYGNHQRQRTSNETAMMRYFRASSCGMTTTKGLMGGGFVLLGTGSPT